PEAVGITAGRAPAARWASNWGFGLLITSTLSLIVGSGREGLEGHRGRVTTMGCSRKRPTCSGCTGPAHSRPGECAQVSTRDDRYVTVPSLPDLRRGVNFSHHLVRKIWDLNRTPPLVSLATPAADDRLTACHHCDRGPLPMAGPWPAPGPCGGPPG